MKIEINISYKTVHGQNTATFKYGILFNCHDDIEHVMVFQKCVKYVTFMSDMSISILKMSYSSKSFLMNFVHIQSLYI